MKRTWMALAMKPATWPVVPNSMISSTAAGGLPQQRPAASCLRAPWRRRPGPHGCGRRTVRLRGGGQLAVLPAEIAVVPGQAEPPRGQRVAPGAGGALQPDSAPAVLADGSRAGGIAEAEVGLLLAPAQRTAGVAFKPI